MKRWIKTNLSIMMGLLVMVGGINYYIDPFWCFEHQNRFNQYQKATNERQQKANYVFFTSKRYDTLLIGSSRTTYMNEKSFKNSNVFNFSASGMRPQEYLTYIDFVVKDAQQPIETIIIGADFFGYLNYGSFMFDNAPGIVNATKSNYYRWKMLFSYDALNNSIRNFRNSFNPNHQNGTYTRENEHRMFKKPVENFNQTDIANDVREYARSEYASEPNPNFFAMMSAIKKSYPDKKIIIYTTPISKPLFDKMVEMGHYGHYEQWLRDLVKIYGNVYHFMYIHPIAINHLHYFADSNHAYAETNAFIAEKITYGLKKNENFGMILSDENIDEQLEKLRVLNGITK